MSNNIIELILRICFISILEEGYIIYFTLFLIGRYDYIQKDNFKRNLKKLMIIAIIPEAIISNLIKFFGEGYMTTSTLDFLTLFIMLIPTTIIIFFLYDERNIKTLVKIFFITILSIAIFTIIEAMSSLMIAKYGLNININQLGKNVAFDFKLAIPERIIEYCILWFIYIKKNSLAQVNITKLIMENKYLRNSIAIFSTLDLIFLLALIKYVFFENVLKNMSLDMQLIMIIIMVGSILISELSIFIYTLSILAKEKGIQNDILSEGGDCL